jgi:DNA mismatch endonuclease (patch repair protein)
MMMVDNLTPEKRSKIMRSIRSSNTKPEMLVRRLVHSMGYRYRLHSRKLPGRPDLVFASRRAVIFVHGCFWHLHASCSISHVPDAKGWSPKLLANRARDKKAVESLQAKGWRVMIIWECDLDHLLKLRSSIETFLN